MIFWKSTKVSPCGTHHTLNGKPIYDNKFYSVMKFHEPGLAPVIDNSGAYHIDIDGEPAYSQRYVKTYGFYNGNAAAIDSNGMFHIAEQGGSLYEDRYNWCGNFQEGYCVVKDKNGNYFHIDKQGNTLYREQYTYAGDFRDDIAVVQSSTGMHTHINVKGQPLHDQWFLDLDVFHKGYARAKDAKGWFHINRDGQAIYTQRYVMVEPFYNDIARVETHLGEIKRIDTEGQSIEILRQSLITPFQYLSGEIVSYWKTQTLRTAVEFDIFDHLPSDLIKLSQKTSLAESQCKRLMRALQELNLVELNNNLYEPTEISLYLRSDARYSLKTAVKHWGGEHYLAWTRLSQALRTNSEQYTALFEDPLFDRLDKDNKELRQYHHAMRVYAEHDYPDLISQIDFSKYQTVLDAAGGEGILLKHLLMDTPNAYGYLLEKANLVPYIDIPTKLADRMEVNSFDLFKPWPKKADAILLSRVLHDWNDEKCHQILKNARDALNKGGDLYIIEMILEDNLSDGGMLDLNMLLIAGGKERTLDDYKSLLKKIALNLQDVSRFRNYSILRFDQS